MIVTMLYMTKEFVPFDHIYLFPPEIRYLKQCGPHQSACLTGLLSPELGVVCVMCIQRYALGFRAPLFPLLSRQLRRSEVPSFQSSLRSRVTHCTEAVVCAVEEVASVLRAAVGVDRSQRLWAES